MSKFVKIRSVTLPVLKMASGVTRYLAILGPMHLGKPIDDDKEPATIAHAVDMETGEEGQLICSTVLANELSSNYPDHSYVRKGFELTSTKVPDKKYNIISLCEVGIPEELEAAITAMCKSAAGSKVTPITPVDRALNKAVVAGKKRA